MTMTRRRLYEILDGEWETGRAGRWFNVFMVSLITANVIAIVLESMAVVHAAFEPWFLWFEVISVAIFTVEYLLRVVVAPANPLGIYRRPLVGRLRFMASPLAIIDLLAILPFFLVAFGFADLRFLRAFRLLRLLKLTRYFPAMQTLFNVYTAQRKALFSAVFVMVFMLVVSSSVMYLIEKDGQPEAFGSIPAAMWWGMATLTTVGYGDVTPLTPFGRVMGTVIAMFGIGMFALPAAILASGFTRETDKQDFLTTWKTVASLPAFRDLDAMQVAEVVDVLEVRTAVPGEEIFGKGDLADAVYFIMRGEVGVVLPDQIASLGEGEFFGELALLSGQTRAATVRATTSCRLMVLQFDDFHRLCLSDDQLRERFERVARERSEVS